jgi:hypothetical protein
MRMDRLGRVFGWLSGRDVGPLTARLAAWAVVAALAGCTMCPDPYDYSGPVPNGSAPQNDFRARSGGILPLGAAPCPWPPLVKKAPGSPSGLAGGTAGSDLRQATFQEPTLADPPADAAQADETVAAPTETMSVLVVVGESENTDAEEADGTPTESESSLAADNPDTLAPISETEPQSPADMIEVADTEEAVPAVPPLAETPGWRPRR